MNAEASSPTVANINEAIDWLQKTGAQVQDFAVEQAPLYCREVVAWEFWNGVAWSSMGLLAILIPVVLLRVFRKPILADYEDIGPLAFFSFFGSAISAIAGLVIFMNSAPDAIKAAVAPRLVIVEHLRGLTK